MVVANAAISFAAATSSTAVAVSSVTSSVAVVSAVVSSLDVSSLPHAAATRLKAKTAAATRRVDLRNVFPFYIGGLKSPTRIASSGRIDSTMTCGHCQEYFLK
jgi:hypothetical protein